MVDFTREAILLAMKLLAVWTSLVFLILCVLVPIAALYVWLTSFK